ncbi:putative RNA-directed DNA polymerase [Helianthus debilis subsp. tardiflorus]
MALLVPFSTTDKNSHNSHKFGFTLSSTNYSYWKTMVQPFLITNHLFDYVDGTIPCPEPTITTTTSSDKEATKTTQPNPNYVTWVSNDAHAHVRMLLLSTISESAFKHVQGTTSRELWLALERAFAPNTTSREYTLKAQLLKIQMKDNETSSDYLTRAQEYADALAAIGEPVKDKDLVMLIMTGLREEYDGLKSTILARQLPTTFSELPGLLSDHEYMVKKPATTPIQAFAATTNRPSPPAAANSIPTESLHALQQIMSQLGLQVQSQSSQPQAFYSSRGRGRGRGPTNQGRNNGGRGYNRNNNNGGNRGQFSWASNQNTVYGTCNRCGIGHVPSECPNRDPNTIRSRQHSANYAEHRAQTSSTWLPDTGSNCHATPDLQSLDNSEPYYGQDSLHVGNGYIYGQYPPHWSK